MPTIAKHLPDSATVPNARERRRYVLLCGAIVAMCLALKLPSLDYPQQEDDELIYWALTKNWLDNGAYSLQGLPILTQLPPSIYDKPLFHHPPLLPILLAPFVMLDNPRAAIIVSWAAHVAAIIGVAILCWVWRRRRWHATHFALWLPVLAVAADPLLTFCARKLWTDGLAGGLAGLAMGLTALATRRGSVAWAIAGGAVFGLAGLAKLPALLALPAGLVLLLLATDARVFRRLVLAMVAFLTATAFLAPWFIIFHRTYGQWFPDWIRPDEALRAFSPSVDREMSRPWHYYLSHSAMIAPVIIVLLIGYIRRWRLILTPKLLVPLVWVASVVGALLVLARLGHGMQLRYLTPAAPGLYAMLAGLLGRADPRRSLLGVGALLAILYGVSSMGYFLYPDHLAFDDIVSLPEIIWRMWADGR